MSNHQPSEEAVNMLLSIVDGAFSRQSAIARLKYHNNDVERVMNDYYDGGNDDSKYIASNTWEEGPFHADRDGNGNNQGISFNIQGADDLGPSGAGRFDGAMSRPPSRTSNNRSPIGKVIDMTADNALMANPSSSMSHVDSGDEDLHRALAMSLEDQGPQEIGITGADEVAFGPANRNEYEQGKWEMVPIVRTSVQEIVVDPEPADRKRDLDVPAFLKPTVAPSRLNALITIYHEIPLIRNIFLNMNDTLPSYGIFPNEWWSGTPIVIPVAQEVDARGYPAYDEVDRELQRLMAFLDKTDRSYGSVDALANLDEVKRMARQRGSDLESSVLYAWKSIMDHSNHQHWSKAIFSHGVQSAASEDDPQQFAILELTPPLKDSLQENIYDIADEVLWPNLSYLELDESPYLSHIAEVIVFKIEGGVEHKRVDIPAIWYPDRYLKSGREAALDMRLKKKAAVDKLEQICKVEEQLSFAPLRSGKLASVKDLFEASLKHDENEIKEGVENDDDAMDSDSQPNKSTSKLSEALRKVFESIDKKLASLRESREKACEELRNLSKLYTEPSDDPAAHRLHTYLLRGVSINKHTMYICRRAEPDLGAMAIGDSPASYSDQWWKIFYSPVGTTPVNVEKVTEEKVLHAAKHESNNTILVYASEKAVSSLKHALPKPLENFVKADNRTFARELPRSESDVEIQSPNYSNADDSSTTSSQFSASSPGKRKYEEDPITGRFVSRKLTVQERELKGDESESSFDSTGTIVGDTQGQREGEVVIGIDPRLLDKTSGKGKEIEMQERSGMPLIGRGAVATNGAVAASRALSESLGTVDGMNMDVDDVDMDLDNVIQRDENVREESAANKALRKVGFAD